MPFYPDLSELHAQVLRVQLHWGGTLGAAKSRPENAADPTDPAYDWARYDELVRAATDAGAQVMFTIFGTPTWANGGRPPTYAPTRGSDLEQFAYAAAKRYSGTFTTANGDVLPRVRYWTAWNEPNLPLGLLPQWRRVGSHWVIQSARDYARICNAVVTGVHGTLIPGELVACGDTAPRGNNAPTSSRPTTSPLAFLRAMKNAGARGFDAYAHHPYPSGPSEAPSMRPQVEHRGHVREPRRPDQPGDEALRPQADLARRVRLPDRPARQGARRVAGQAGALPDAGGRDWRGRTRA